MKKVLLVFLVSAGMALHGFAQSPEKYADFIDIDGARKHLSILASDEFEGRMTGTRGAEKAANYIAEQFKSLGLKAPVDGSYFQDVPIYQSDFAVGRFVVNGKSLQRETDFYVPRTFASKDIQSKELVFVGYGISSENYDELKNVDLAGKVVLFIKTGEPVKNGISAISKGNSLSDWGTSAIKKVQAICAKKPSLIISVVPEGTRFPTERRRHEPLLTLGKRTGNEASVEVIEVTQATADLLLKKSGQTLKQLKQRIDQSGVPLTKVARVDLSVQYGMKQEPVKAVNVLGYLEGTDLKDELVVLSAHYDHVGLNPEGPDKVYNGADDDGSGTTAVIELAEAFMKAKKEGKGPRRSILFLAVVGEEEGLFGSEHYSNSPVFPLKNTVTNLNIDMIGRIDPAHKADTNYCYLIGSDKLSTDLHKISEKANATYTRLKIDYKYNDPNDPERIYYRSDHYNFAKHNIPIIFYFNGVHEDYHKPSDEVSKINFPLLVKRAQLVFHTAWDLVHRDQRPAVDVNKK